MSEPPRKKARLSSSAAASSTLFAPFRALGHVSNEIPFALQVQNAVGLQKPEFNIISCLGRSWAMWGGKDMRIRFVGPEALEPISSLAVDGNDVFASAGSNVFRYRRGRIEGTYDTETSNDQLGEILTFGAHLVALEKRGRKMFVWNKEDETLHTTIDFSHDFHASHLVHPATYLNKLLIGSREGGLQLWNIATSSLIHAFAPQSISAKPSAITAMCQSPAVDVVALGFEDGRVIAYDIRMGEELFNLRAATAATTVTAISFRTDNVAHTLATAYADGSIAIWDLEPSNDAQEDDEGDRKQPGRLLHVARNAHDGSIGGLQWLPGQALLVSSGADNSIKQWAFDTPTAEPRLLKSRSGHTAPPSLIRYYGDDGKAILSAGGGQRGKSQATEDRSLRYTSIVRDSRSFELSQGSLAKKASALSAPSASLKAAPIVAMHYSNARSRDWDDVVTCHAGESAGRTWTVESKRKGNWTFADASADEARGTAKCCHVSACGNFGLVGFSHGIVGLWNMQSGIRRKTFDTRSGNRASAVSGIACDALNRRVVVATHDGQLHWFDFHTSKHQGSVSVASGISSTLLQRDNNMLATVCDDLSVRVIDIETRRNVRTLRAFRGRVIDVAFSPDSRWLIVASADSVVRTFDLPTGRLIDAFRTPSALTSLTFSPTGDFLATAHVDSVGVFLWANRAQFAEVSSRTLAQEDAIPEIRLPSLQGDEEAPVELSEYTAPTVWSDQLDLPTTPSHQDLLTLSDQPRSKWQTLLNLDTIRARNKPKEPPKAPERAPFFLPTLSGPGETRFDVSSKQMGKEATVSRLALSTASVRSETVDLLLAGDDEAFFGHLLSLSASALDLELRTLTPPDLAPLLHALTGHLTSHRDFEAVQAILAVLLRVQGDVLVGMDDEIDEEDRNAALDALASLKVAQDAAAMRLGGLVSFALGALSFIKGLTLS